MRPPSVTAVLTLAIAPIIPAAAVAQDDPAPVAPEITILSKNARNPDNRVRLRVKCADGVRDFCKGTLSAKAVAGGPVLVTGPVEVTSGSDSVVTFRVTTAGKSAFRKKAAIAMAFTIKANDSRGTSATTKQKLTVKRGR